jgi:dihydroxy-acid dehydratase
VVATPPRVGVTTPDLAESLRAAGAEPVLLDLPEGRPRGGVALAREWVADAAEISCAGHRLDGLLLAAEEPEDLAGLVLAALRLNLPAVAAPCDDAYFSVALAALGLSPPAGDPVPVAVEIARTGGPRPGDIVDEFSLVNALRAGLSLGGGPELLVYLSAVAREAGSSGFSQTLRVITPETPRLAAPDSGWFAEHGTVGLLATLGEALNDTATVAGRLREILPSGVPGPPQVAGSRLTFVEARASGAVALCRVGEDEHEISGKIKVFHSEKFAVRIVEGRFLEIPSLLVVGGCGPRGEPGLSRLERLSQILLEDGLAESMPVITDGLPPRSGSGTWISLFSPEAAAGGVIGRLRDGDSLRFALDEGRIRTGVRAEEFEAREPREYPDRAGTGYSARYALTALPALEGAGFG